MTIVTTAIGVHSNHSIAPRTAKMETGRRRALCVDAPFPAIVRGINKEGHTFEERVQLDDISAEDLHVQLSYQVRPGTKLFVLIRLTLGGDIICPGPSIAVKGVATRIMLVRENRWKIKLAFIQQRFLFASEA